MCHLGQGDGDLSGIRSFRRVAAREVHRRRGIHDQQRADHGAVISKAQEDAIRAREELPVQPAGIVALAERPVFREFRIGAADAGPVNAGGTGGGDSSCGPGEPPDGIQQSPYNGMPLSGGRTVRSTSSITVSTVTPSVSAA